VTGSNVFTWQWRKKRLGTKSIDGQIIRKKNSISVFFPQRRLQVGVCLGACVCQVRPTLQGCTCTSCVCLHLQDKMLKLSSSLTAATAWALDPGACILCTSQKHGATRSFSPLALYSSPIQWTKHCAESLFFFYFYLVIIVHGLIRIKMFISQSTTKLCN
jgi:hypothetical protein